MAENGQNHIKSTFKHALIYSASGMIAKAVGFIMLPVYAHFLRGEGYGIIGMIDVVLSVVSMLIGYGIQGAMSRFYFEKTTDKERHELISTAIFLMMAMVLVVSIPLLLFNEQIAFLAFGKQGMGYYIILAMLTFMATMTSKAAETYILIKQKSLLYAVLSVMKLCLGLSLNIYLIVYLQLGVLGYLYSGLIVAIVFSSFMHGFALFHVGLRFVWQEARAILRYSLPLLPGYLAMFVRNNTDRVLLRTFLGLAQLGAFEMLFKFATLIGFFIVEPFNKIMGVKCFEIADQENGAETISRIFTLYLSVMLFVGLVLSLEIPLILKILTPEEFWLPGHIAALAVLSRILLASYYYLYFGLLYAKKTHKISLIQIATTFVSFVSCLLLIKPLGIFGAVSASCLAVTFQCVLAYKWATPYYRIPFEFNKIAIILLSSVAIFLALNSGIVENGLLKPFGLAGYIEEPLRQAMSLSHLEAIKDGKLVAYVLNNIPLLLEGGFKFILCFSFLGGLIGADILPRKAVSATIKARSLKPLLALGK